MSVSVFINIFMKVVSIYCFSISFIFTFLILLNLKILKNLVKVYIWIVYDKLSLCSKAQF